LWQAVKPGVADSLAHLPGGKCAGVAKSRLECLR
jgi:hypothetical protein